MNKFIIIFSILLLAPTVVLAAAPVPSTGFIITTIFFAWLTFLILFFVVLRIFGYRNFKRIFIGSFIGIIGFIIAGSVSFKLTLQFLGTTTVSLWPWEYGTTIYFIIGGGLLFFFFFFLAKCLFKLKMRYCVLLAIIIAILFNPAWVPSLMSDFVGKIYPFELYELKGTGQWL